MLSFIRCLCAALLLSVGAVRSLVLHGNVQSLSFDGTDYWGFLDGFVTRQATTGQYVAYFAGRVRQDFTPSLPPPLPFTRGAVLKVDITSQPWIVMNVWVEPTDAPEGDFAHTLQVEPLDERYGFVCTRSRIYSFDFENMTESISSTPITMQPVGTGDDGNPRTGFAKCRADWQTREMYTLEERRITFDPTASRLGARRYDLDTLTMLSPEPTNAGQRLNTQSSVLHNSAAIGPEFMWAASNDAGLYYIKRSDFSTFGKREPFGDKLDFFAVATYDGPMGAEYTYGAAAFAIVARSEQAYYSMSLGATSVDDLGYNGANGVDSCEAIQLDPHRLFVYVFCQGRLVRMDARSLRSMASLDLGDTFLDNSAVLKNASPHKIVYDPFRERVIVLGWRAPVAIEANVVDCSVHTTCGDCVGPSADALCGWCAATQQCGIANECVGEYRATEQCPQLLSASPRTGASGGGSNVTVTLDEAALSSSAHGSSELLCVVGGDQTQATRISDTELWCLAPGVGGSGAVGAVDLGVTYLGQPLVSNTVPFGYYDCAPFATCGGCLGAQNDCGWCLETSTCGGLSACNGGTKATACAEVSSVAVPDRGSLGARTPVRLTLTTGVFVDGAAVTCLFGTLPSANATVVDATHIDCVPPLDDAEIGVVSVSIVYADVGAEPLSVPYATGSASYRFYDCAVSTCELCTSDIRPECGWCLTSSACVNRDMCDAPGVFWLNGASVACPTLSALAPTSGAAAGGTVISVSGTDFFDSNRWQCDFGGKKVNATFVSVTELRCVTPLAVPDTVAVGVYYDGRLYNTEQSSQPFDFIGCDSWRTCALCTAQGTADCGWCAETLHCTNRPSCGVDGAGVFSATECPRITSLDPPSGSVRGGSVVTIGGELLVDNVWCQFGDEASVQATRLNDKQVQCTAPMLGDGSIDADEKVSVRLILKDEQSGEEVVFAESQQQFVYEERQLQDELPTWAWLAIFGGIVCLCLMALLCAACYMRKFRVQKRAVAEYQLKHAAPKLTAATLQSVAFSNIDTGSGSSVKKVKNAKKLERMLLEDPPLLSAMAVKAGSADVDKLAKALVVLHECNGTTVRLINHFTSTEVAMTKERSNLFRTNSIATKMFQTYSKMHGVPYLHKTLGAIANETIHEASESPDDEVEGDANLQKWSMLVLAQRALRNILASPDEVPVEFRAIFSNVRSQMTQKFPVTAESLLDVVYETLKGHMIAAKSTIDEEIKHYNRIDDVEQELSRSLGDGHNVRASEAIAMRGARSADEVRPRLDELEQYVSALASTVDDLQTQVMQVTAATRDMNAALNANSADSRDLLEKQNQHQISVAVGGFFFLRFVCPSIMTPESYGLVDEAPSREARRPLILLAKVLQNLSNGVPFGSKESHMRRMNEFIQGNTTEISKFFRELSDASPDEEGTPIKVPDDIRQWALHYCHNYLLQNGQHITKELNHLHYTDSADAVQQYVNECGGAKGKTTRRKSREILH